MMEEKSIAIGSNRLLKIAYAIGVIVNVCVIVGCALVVAKAQETARTEHTRAMDAIRENGELKNKMAELVNYADAAAMNWHNCQANAQRRLSDSVDRLQTKTYLVVTNPAASPEVYGNGFSAPRLQGIPGMILSLVMNAAGRRGVVARTDVWVLPTQMEPGFAGDSQNAWVIHADARTGQPVDQPHHPAPIQKAQP